MDADAVDKQLAALRAGDETIADALAKLETQLTAWLSVMRDGQAAIVAGLTRTPPAEAPPGAPDVPQPSEAPDGAEASAPREELAADVIEPAPETPDVAREPESSAESEPQPKAAPGGGMFQTSVPIRGVPKPERPKPADASESGAPAFSKEDEELLAELDEETARLIRVRRRLCNNERSVRELLDELQGEREPDETRQQQRNRWWRRPNEQQSD
jgi:hypothetical protein